MLTKEHIEQERTAFEEWASHSEYLNQYPLVRNNDGSYIVKSTNDAWGAWIARTKLFKPVLFDIEHARRIFEDHLKSMVHIRSGIVLENDMLQHDEHGYLNPQFNDMFELFLCGVDHALGMGR